MDWMDILRVQCGLRSQSAVAAELGVSLNTVCQTLLGTYPGSNKKLRRLVEERYPDCNIKLLENDRWKDDLARLCKQYTAASVARELKVSVQPLYMILKGEYTENSKIKRLFLLHFPGLEERLKAKPRRKGGNRIGRRPDINLTNRRILLVIDEIFCSGIATEDDLREKFPRYSLSRTLNHLVANGYIRLILQESELHGKGKRFYKRAYKLGCNCGSPGLTEQCIHCPLGCEILRIEGNFLEEADQEDLKDAC